MSLKTNGEPLAFPPDPLILGKETARVPVGGLREHPRNPRRGDVEGIKASLLRHGQYLPLTVNRSTRTVLRGNHTLRAAQALGWTEIDVYFVDVDDELADRILLVDNRLSDLAGYDEKELAELLQSLQGDLAATGAGGPRRAPEPAPRRAALRGGRGFRAPRGGGDPPGRAGGARAAPPSLRRRKGACGL